MFNHQARYNSTSTNLRRCLTIILLLCCQSSQSAETVIPNVCESADGDAYTAAFAVPIRQQELYSASQFPTQPILISELQYRPDVQWGLSQGAFSADLSRIQFRLSTTPKASGALSLTFAENIGNDETVVFDAPWTFATQFAGPTGGPKLFDIRLPLQKPFLYDPSKGNLLVEVRNFGRAPAVYVHDDSRYGNLCQRIFIEDPTSPQATSSDQSAAVLKVVYSAPNGAPIITTQPKGGTYRVGDTVDFSVVASGGSPLTYQWYFNDTPISDATLPSFSIHNVNKSDAGRYTVRVSNGKATAVSSVADITVVVASSGVWVTPIVAKDAEGDAFTGALAVPIRQQEVYSASQLPQSPIQITEIHYRPDTQWGASQGPFSASLSQVQIRLSTTTKAAGLLSYEFAENVGTDETIVFDGPWTFATQYLGPSTGPKAFDIILKLKTPFLYNPAKGNLLVELRNFGRAPAVYVHDDSRFGGLMQRIFVENPSATRAASGDLSAAVMELVYEAKDSPPFVTQQPKDRFVLEGNSLDLSVLCIGVQPFTYQWFINDTAIINATNQHFTIPALSPSDSGSYHVAVSNAFGYAISSNATVSVQKAQPNSFVVPNICRDSEGDAYTAAFAVPIRQQEVYSASQFPPVPIRINELRFRPDVQWGTSQGAFFAQLSRIVFRLSTSKKSPGSLSYTFSENVGGDETVVYDAPWTLQTSYTGPQSGPKDFDIILPLQHEFLYDPSQGNLLVEVRNYGRAPSVYVHDDSRFGGLMQRIFIENPEATAATSGDLSAAVMQVGYSSSDTAPIITQQPLDVNIRRGSNATFTVSSFAVPKPTYQWLRDHNPIEGATSSTLSLESVDFGSSGLYSVVISNALGSVTSRDAKLFVRPSPTYVYTPEVKVSSGALFRLPIYLQGSGHENGVAMSLSFNKRILSFVDLEISPELQSAFVNINTNDLALGRLGFAVALQSSQTLSDGTNKLGDLVLRAAPLLSSEQTKIPFSDQPILREVVDNLANTLEVEFSAGNITVEFHGFEADVAPRSSPDQKLSLADWVQVGRFVAGLDEISSPDEYQHVDCAPKETLGDGALTIRDWVQAGRYVAGLDPITVVGGPTTNANVIQPPPLLLQSTDISKVCIIDTTGDAGDIIKVPVTLTAAGGEAAVGFSVQFDTNKLGFVGAELGKDAGGSLLNVNTKRSSSGRIGIALSLPSGAQFSAGNKQVALLKFSIPGIKGGTTPLAFVDSPVGRELVNSGASLLPADYTSATVTIAPGAPELLVTRTQDSLDLSWSGDVSGYVVESSASLNPAIWAPVAATPEKVGNTYIVHLSPAGPQSYFRIRKSP